MKIPRTINMKTLQLLISRSFQLKLHYFRLYILDNQNNVIYLEDTIKTIVEYGIQNNSNVFIEETDYISF